jgi:transposase
VLAQRWGISIPAAAATLQNTTQEGVRNVYIPAERKTRKKAPWLKFPAVKGKFYADQMFSKLKSVHGHIGATVYTNGLGYDRIYPWKRKGDHHETIMDLIHDVGVPQTLVTDNAPEETMGRAREVCRQYRIAQKTTVPYSPWQNLAEASIREMKKSVRRTIRRTGTPPRLWSYCAIWCTAIRRLTSNTIPQLQGRVPEEHVTGSTPDISSYVMFDWYQLVYYWTPTAEFPFEKKLIGRWIGIAENCNSNR